MQLTHEQLEAFAESVPALFALIDQDCRYRMCSTFYQDWVGLRREEIIGKTASEVLGETMWRTIEPRVKQALAGKRMEFETEAIYRHGRRRQIRAVYTPLRNPDGTVWSISVLVVDITREKEIQAELRAGEERYRSLFDSIDEGFCVIEVLFNQQQEPVDYFFHEVNPAFEKQSGMRGAVGKRMLEFVTSIESHWLQNYGRVATTGEPIRFAAEYRSLNRWFDVYAFRVGRPEEHKVAVLFNNITQHKLAEIALRESEARFRNMADNSPMMIWVTEADGRCTHLNKRWYDFTGQTPESGLGLGWLKAVHPDDRARAEADFLAANADRAPFRTEYRLRRKDGVYHWAIDAASPRFSEDGEYLGYIGSVIDIHDRKEAEVALRQAKEQAEQASRAKDEFLAQLSHELRTPLTPVLMTATALGEDEQLPAAVRDQLTMIARNVALEARLIDDLLDLTRITHGKLTLRLELCDVHELLRLVVEIISEESREKNISVQLQLEAANRNVLGDSARLQQVFWNLLRNAVKFTPSGGHVTIRSFNRASDVTGSAPRLCVEVADDGIGFDTAAAQRLFRPFERGKIAHDARFPGLGLGLAIAKAIVDGHQGTIQAQSNGPGLGASILVELKGATAKIAEPPPSPGAEIQAVTSRKLRLLLVEDHLPTAQVLSRLLARAGHTVTTANNVAQAVEAAEKERFDIVVSDLGLPDGTGIDLMKTLKARHGLAGIALSGYGMDEDLRRTREAGFVAHLIKPVDMKEVIRVLDRFAAS